ncbi:PREDICTED: zinc finger protein 672-like [Dinoponera quadriceps]|uniref:Zinc finger protein 672-like n=1 Tax=Dinoponera quadriceps TaxID=609295 RepID=A0A6P3X9N5_DINQU|nr:PREDICTED: zinc finger protein 672-like [Dinoponera quadriceps]
MLTYLVIAIRIWIRHQGRCGRLLTFKATFKVTRLVFCGILCLAISKRQINMIFSHLIKIKFISLIKIIYYCLLLWHAANYGRIKRASACSLVYYLVKDARLLLVSAGFRHHPLNYSDSVHSILGLSFHPASTTVSNGVERTASSMQPRLIGHKNLQRNCTYTPVMPSFKDLATLWMVKQRNNVFSYRCEQCGKGYQHRATLLRHTRHECGKEPQFKCPYCAHRTKQRGNLYQHIRTNHPGKNVFSSSI